MNKIEQIKAEKDGLDVDADIARYAELGWQAIQESDVERLKWWGVFMRRHTPGHFMMRIRIPNGITNAAQLRAIAALAQRHGRGILDITTRQQIQLRPSSASSARSGSCPCKPGWTTSATSLAAPSPG